MFAYKDAEFFTDYFNNSPDFRIVSPFAKSKDKGEENLYVGIVEVLKTIHPLIVRVEIPVTFPHNKLTFRTKSLSGYPHLIHTGKIEHGDWFCLNTPFAETADEQLNQEIIRLKQWILHQMREDLPTVIEDPNVQKALRVANAYEWENPDEVKEFSSKAIITLVGDGFKNPSNFTEKIGYFYGVRTPDNRVYAFREDRIGVTYKLPYILVKEKPGDSSVIEDFLKMRDFYGWNEEICHHLLPNYNYHSGNFIYSDDIPKYDIEFTLDESLALLDEIKKELDKPESYLDVADLGFNLLGKKDNKRKVISNHKPFLYAEIEKVKKEIISNDGVKMVNNPWNRIISDEDEFDEESAMIDRWVDHGQFVYHYFIVGFEWNNGIDWMLFFTNPASVQTQQTGYDIKVKNININKITSIKMWHGAPLFVDESMFFGRGAICKRLSEKRIALVGLGAIGSMIAESLAHSGIKKIGLWDSDIVEPGNICRSSYSLQNLGHSKVEAIREKWILTNPFIEMKEINGHGLWGWQPNWNDYLNGSFYDNVNYKSQEESIKELDGYDIIIDCTGSNEMLHFLSYAIQNKEIISLCITNHAKELVCTTNLNGNPFELRKAYLSRIAQDTKNYYVEGNGCYSPTFLAKYFDIASLVNYFVRDLDISSSRGKCVSSCIYSYCENGILKDSLNTYKLRGYDILLNISRETLMDAEELFETDGLVIGYVLGSYSANGKEVMITQIIPYQNAVAQLDAAFKTSKGIIDYIGDFAYADMETDSFKSESFDNLLSKASDSEVNTNNPLLALKHNDGSLSFMLLINGNLVPFVKIY